MKILRGRGAGRWAAALLLPIVLAVCPAVAPAAEAAPAEGEAVSQLLAAHSNWIQLINDDRNEEAMSYIPNDAAFLGTSGSVRQGQQLTERVRELTRLKGFHITFTLVKASVADDGATGFVVGETVIQGHDQNGTKVTSSQRLLTVWKRSPTKGWQCYLNVTMRPQP